VTSHRDPTEHDGLDRPSHPTKQATLLLVGVTILVVALAVLSATGHV